MNIYECALLFESDVLESSIDKSLNKISKIVKITDIEKWGIRQMVYPVKGYQKAYYVILLFEDTTEEKLINQLKKDKEILRFVCVKKECTNENNNTTTL